MTDPRSWLREPLLLFALLGVLVAAVYLATRPASAGGGGDPGAVATSQVEDLRFVTSDPQPPDFYSSLPIHLREAVIEGARRTLQDPLHLLFALAFGLAGGLVALGRGLGVFFGGNLLGIVVVSLTGLEVPPIGGLGLGVAAVVFARMAWAGSYTRMMWVALAAGLIHGLALPVDPPGSLAMLMGMDAACLAVGLLMVVARKLCNAWKIRQPVTALVGVTALVVVLITAATMVSPVEPGAGAVVDFTASESVAVPIHGQDRPIEAVPVLVPVLLLSALSALLTLAALVAISPRRVRQGLWVSRLMMIGACMAASVLTFPLQAPWLREPVPEPARAWAIGVSLLDNVYRTLDQPDEGAVRDGLQTNLTGAALIEVCMAELRDPQLRVEVLMVDAVRDLHAGPFEGFHGEFAWTVVVAVAPFDERELRQEHYRAELAFVPFEGAWKLQALRWLDE